MPEEKTMNNQITPTAPLAINVVRSHFDGGSCTYFRTSDVIPFIDAAGLNVYTGNGQGRSWGRATVRSTVRTLTPNVIAVEVTGWHKHTVSPVGGNYYFVNEAGAWVRRTANAKAVKAALAATLN